MKRTHVSLLAASFIMLAITCACERNEPTPSSPEMGVLTITINPQTLGTKSTDAQNEQSDNDINNLGVFIFDGLTGAIEIYEYLTDSEILSEGTFNFTAKQGNKNVVCIANMHKVGGKLYSQLTSLRTWSEMEVMAIELTDELIGDFTMIGRATVSLAAAGIVNMKLERMVSRINIRSLAVNFDGTPYDGQSLTNVRAYLINVEQSKTVAGQKPTGATLLNAGMEVAADASKMAITNGLGDDIGTLEDGVAHTTPHYFFTYQNSTNLNSSTTCLRLVIEADFPNGETAYYPISIPGIDRNTTADYDITITHNGGSEPNDVSSNGNLSFTLSTKEWTTLPFQQVTY